MQVGELSRQTKVSTRALRHYEAQGLIHSRRLENGYRDYESGTLETVRWIREMIECGFSTRQIHDFLSFFGEASADPAKFEACLAQHSDKLRAMDSLIGVLTERRQRLAGRIASFRHSRSNTP